jgi:hypothetical protein
MMIYDCILYYTGSQILHNFSDRSNLHGVEICVRQYFCDEVPCWHGIQVGTPSPRSGATIILPVL